MIEPDWQHALFTQAPPRLGNQYRGDPLLASWLRRTFPQDLAREVEAELDELGGVESALTKIAIDRFTSGDLIGTSKRRQS